MRRVKSFSLEELTRVGADKAHTIVGLLDDDVVGLELGEQHGALLQRLGNIREVGAAPSVGGATELTKPLACCDK